MMKYIYSAGHQESRKCINLCKVLSMVDNCGEWVECMGVASRKRVWLVGVGGIYGCG